MTEIVAEKRGRGRPVGAASRLSREARARAQETGLLPHEILLSIARGEPQTIKKPIPLRGGGYKIVEELVPVDLETIKTAATAAAPYYAPKISTVEVITGVSDDDLDAIIARSAAEAGLSLGNGGEGSEGEGQAGPAPAAGRKRVSLS